MPSIIDSHAFAHAEKNIHDFFHTRLQKELGSYTQGVEDQYSYDFC